MVEGSRKRSEQGGESERYRGRYTWLMAVASLAFFLLVARLWTLQIIRGEEFWMASTENIIRDIEISPSRVAPDSTWSLRNFSRLSLSLVTD